MLIAHGSGSAPRFSDCINGLCQCSQSQLLKTNYDLAESVPQYIVLPYETIIQAELPQFFALPLESYFAKMIGVGDTNTDERIFLERSMDDRM